MFDYLTRQLYQNRTVCQLHIPHRKKGKPEERICKNEQKRGSANIEEPPENTRAILPHQSCYYVSSKKGLRIEKALTGLKKSQSKT